MGALMRQWDWSATPLGAPPSWPQSLRTVVRLMLNTGHPMCIWWGPQRACLYNDAYRRSIGPERHPGSLGRPAREVGGETWDLILPQIEQVMSGGATRHVNQRVPIARHGSREDVYWTCGYSPIDDEASPNGIGGVLAVCTETTAQVPARNAEGQVTGIDVAEYLRTERSLRENEARFRSALKAGRMGSWETDYVSMTRQWSEEGMALFGLSLPDGVGQVGGPADEYVAALHPSDRHLAREFRRLADQQDAFDAEYRIVRPDGSEVWLTGRGLVVSRGVDGRAQRLVSIMADATERHQAEERLRLEHARLEVALRAGRMGTFDMNIRDGVLWWSPETYEVFGVTPDSFVPTPPSVLALLHPDEQDKFVRLRKEAIAGHRPFVHEFRICRPDGTEAWVAHRGEAEYDAGGSAVRSFGITMDITDRKQVEEALREADQKKDRFIAVLAHELRNPLAPIRNGVELLRRAGGDAAKRAWCLDVIDRQVKQMAHLLDDLLDSSRLSRGQLRLRLQPLGLEQALEQAVEIAKPHLEAAGHDLQVALPSRRLDIQGDLTRLAQVFSNILVNAAKYTPPKGRIALHAEVQGSCAVVTVTDNGIGIDEEHLTHIFEMFSQIESPHRTPAGGQGIGLALAKGLVELHGGTIEARSEGLGKGSCFEVRLPLLEEGSAPDKKVEPDLVFARRYRILVVDDMADSADSLAEALRAMDQQTEVAYDGPAAIRSAVANRPDLVLMDLGMPGMDGFEACRRMRSEPWGGGLLIVAQTGWGQDHDREKTRLAGFDHHVVKPISVAELIGWLAGRNSVRGAAAREQVPVDD